MIVLTLATTVAAVSALQLPFGSPLGQQAALGHQDSAVTTDRPANYIDTSGPADNWGCHLHGWVRAPDLVPDTVVPAEARLVTNGTTCGDIARWQVGLRFKERALIKMKSKDVELPTRPYANPLPGDVVDRRGDLFYDSYIDLFRSERSAYKEKLRDRSLWDIRGAQRDVFNSVLDLDPPRHGADDLWLDTVQSFVVHVPNTNVRLWSRRHWQKFPPIRLNHGGINSPEQVMTVAETFLEYYFLVTLTNGSVIELPVNVAAFLPRPAPVSPIALAPDVWPKTVSVESPRTAEYYTYGIARSIPQCESDTLAGFQVSFSKVSPDPIVQGHNVTFNVTVVRSGNGTEYPQSMWIRSTTQLDYTWAREQVNSEEDCEALTKRRSGMSGRHMLMASSQEKLERLRDQRAQQYTSPRSLPLFERRGVCHRFNITNATASDVYSFLIDVPFDYDIVPSFQATFERSEPVLSFELRTTFLCAPLDDKPRKAMPQVPLDASSEWTPYELPPVDPAAELRWRQEHGPRLTHQGSVSVNVLSSTPPGDKPPVHYLDPRARGPVLTRHVDDKVQFAPLGTVRPEQEHELRKCRWGPYCTKRAQTCLRTPCGGQHRHAAKLWARKMAIERGEPVGTSELHGNLI